MFFFSPGSSPHSSETVDGDLIVTAGGRLLRCDPLCGQRVGAESFLLSELKDAKIDGVAVPEPCALSADLDGVGMDPLCGQSLSRCRFENTGLYHDPELHGELVPVTPRSWLEDGLVFSVGEEVFFIDFLAQPGASSFFCVRCTR